MPTEDNETNEAIDASSVDVTDNPDTPTHEGTERDMKRQDRTVRVEMDKLATPALLAEIAHKAEFASKNRRLRSVGYDATDVLGEVVTDITSRLNNGMTLEGIWRGLLENTKHAESDLEDPAVRGLAIGKLCAAAAMRIKRAVEAERPVGDARAVVGEGAMTEQETLSDANSPALNGKDGDGNDRQMRAVLSRRGRMQGIHRATVGGVADDSFRTMRDNATRMFGEIDNAVMVHLMDGVFTPSTIERMEAWMDAFGTYSPADVLFGLDSSTGEHRVIEGDKKPNDYPTRWPYKPLLINTVRTGAPEDPKSEAHKHHLDRCLIKAHLDPTNPWTDAAVRRYVTWRVCCIMARSAQPNRDVSGLHFNHVGSNETLVDPRFTLVNPVQAGRGWDVLHDSSEQPRSDLPAKPGELRIHPTYCPPGLVTRWRSLEIADLTANPEQRWLLRAALKDWANYVQSGIQQYWKDQAAMQVVRAQRAQDIAEFHGVGTGDIADSVDAWDAGTLRWLAKTGATHATERGQDWQANAKDAHLVIGSKERRFLSFFSDVMGLGGRMLPDDMYVEDIWTTEQQPDLPGSKRWTETITEMLTAPVWVDNVVIGKATVERVVKGKTVKVVEKLWAPRYVSGLPGVIADARDIHQRRKALRDGLLRLAPYMALAMAGPGQS